MLISLERTINLGTTVPVERIKNALYYSESNAHKWVIAGKKDDAAIALSGSVTAKFLRADRATVAIEGSIENGKAAVTLGDECYAVPGAFSMAVFVTDGNTSTCVYACTGTVLRTMGNVVIDGGTQITGIDDLIAQIEAARATIPATYAHLVDTVGSIAPSVIKNNLLTGFPDVSRNSNNVAITGNPIDGIVVTTSGTASANTSLRVLGDNSAINLKAGRTYLYTVSQTDNTQPVSTSTWQLTLRNVESLSSDAYRIQHKDGLLFSVESDISVVPFIRVLSGTALNDTIKPVLMEYATSVGDMIKYRSGRTAPNMFDRAFFAANSSLSSGVTFTNNFDGTCTLDGKNTSDSAQVVSISNTYGILLEAGKTYAFSSNGESDITPSDDTYRMVIRKVSAAGTNISVEYPIGNTFTPTETTLYRFMIRVAAGFEFDELTLRPTLYDCTDYQIGIDNSSVFKVCTYNVGNFNMGASGQAQGTDTVYRGLVNAFSKCAANIYMFCEWDKFWDTQNAVLSETVFSRFKPVHSWWVWANTDSYVAQMIYSDYPFIMERHFFLNDGHSRHLTDDVVMISGKPVHFISVHMNASDIQSRYDNYDKIFNFLNSNGYEYFVIAGDFNHGYGAGNILATARQEVDYVENLGAVSVQGGFYGSIAHDGFINTYYHGNDLDGIRPYDNIFVSPNIRIRNVFKVAATGTEADPLGSDHFPLVAELEII